jgi:hypothetical protein
MEVNTMTKEDFIRKNYKKYTIKELAIRLNVTNSHISYLLAKYKLSRKEFKGKFKRIYKYDIKHNYFKKWSHEMAYILGFIVADGCIDIDDGRYRLKFGLSIKDIDLLSKIRDVIAKNKPIKTYKQSIKLDIDSKEMISDLIVLGILPRKSLNPQLPSNIPEEYKWSLLLGLFDGDGHVCYKERMKFFKQYNKKYKVKDKYIKITAKTKEFLDIINYSYFYNTGKVRKLTNKKRGHIWHDLFIHKQNIIKDIYEKLYSNSSIYLLRKKQQMEMIINDTKDTLSVGSQAVGKI